MWEAVSGHARFSISAHKKGVNAVAFSPDSRLLVSAGNAMIRYAFGYSSNAWLELQWYMFAIVVMFYMHLKRDKRIFAAVFSMGLIMGIGLIVALVALILG